MTRGFVDRRTACGLLAAPFVALAAGRPVRAEAGPIRVGVVATLSGSFANSAKLYQACVSAFQKTHGTSVGGRTVEVIFRDDTGLAPDTARRLAQELVVGEGVSFLAGVTFSPNALAVGDVSTKAKVPLLITNASASNLIANIPYAIRLSYTQGQLTSALAAWALKNGITSVYNVFLDYSTGIDAKTGFSKAFTDGGGKVVGEVSFPISTGDFTTYVERVKDAKPQAVFVFLATAGRGFLKAFRDAGLDKAGIRVLGTGDLVAEEMLPAIGEFADGAITAMNYSHEHPSALNRQVIATVDADPGTPPLDFGGVAAWDAMTAIYKAIDAQRGGVDPDKTIAFFKGMKFESPRGPIAIDPATRDIVQNIYIRRTQQRNGTWTNVEIETIPHVRDPLEH